VTRAADLDLSRWRPDARPKVLGLHQALDEASDRLDAAFHGYGKRPDAKRRRRWLWRQEEWRRALSAYQAVALSARNLAPPPSRRPTLPQGMAAVMDAPAAGHIRWNFRSRV
jgi:hypothetical protein